MITKTRTVTQRLAAALAAVAATMLLVATGMTTLSQDAAPPNKECPIGNCSPI
ncbi:hypothetical protein [Pseudonocardia acaciae]|uniref:hypothetical protein n=1 Tax=Pseudonocardia acaciae TaxID=551276 RepID=UPI000AE5DE8E|nr:hypothetical protein [Pseudonocardia acaciae]